MPDTPSRGGGRRRKNIRTIETFTILRRAGLGYAWITKVINELADESPEIQKVSISTIRRWGSRISIKANTPLLRYSEYLRPELALILGYIRKRGIGKGRKLAFKTKHQEVARAAAILGASVHLKNSTYYIRFKHSTKCLLQYLLDNNLWACVRAAWPEHYLIGCSLALSETKSVRYGADPGSLTIEAILLCKGMEPEEIVQLLEKAKECGLKIDDGVTVTYVKKVLRGEIPEWYVPSPLFLALVGNTHGGRMPIRVTEELSELLGEFVAEVSSLGAFHSSELEHAEKYAKLMSQVTGVQYSPFREEWEKEYLKWRVRETRVVLYYMYTTGLYKIVALRWPREFLRGLFDGDGSVVAWITCGKLRYAIKLALKKRERDVAEFVKKLLAEFGIKARFENDPRCTEIRIT